MRPDLVRTTCWLGAFVDAAAGVQLLLPSNETYLGFPGLRAEGPAGYSAVIAAVLMFGFSALLIWAARHGAARRGVLAITLGVVLALAGVNIGYGVTGRLPWSPLVAPLLIQAVLAALFARATAVAWRGVLSETVAGGPRT